jgi:glycosyltransferase involved in cell wall biosynthesis
MGGDARLRVAGDGPEELKRTLQKCAAVNGLSRRVDWLGFLTGESKAAFLETLDVLVLASEYECFGVAVAEAMAYGVPVIVSSRTGIGSIVTRYGAGVVVEPTTPDLAAALLRIAADPELARKMGAQGPVAVREELSMQAYGTVVRAIYKDVVSTWHESANRWRARPRDYV